MKLIPLKNGTGVYQFNKVTDGLVTKPIAILYNEVVPDVAKMVLQIFG